MLAEVTTTAIFKQKKFNIFFVNKTIAKRGWKVAKNARGDIKKQLGHSVILNLNAKTSLRWG